MVAALSIDALGTGLFLPVSLLYFTTTTSLSTPQVGLGLSLAALVRLPLGPALGALVDRLGPGRVLVLGNVLQALGFAAYLLVDSLTALVVTTVVVQAGNTAFWSSYPSLVTEVSAPGQRERWFGFLGALRNTGFGLGGLLGAVAISTGGVTGYRVIVVANALTFAAAAALLVRDPAARRRTRPTERVLAPWRTVLADRPYLALALTNVAAATGSFALTIVFPLWAVESLGLPAWVPGVGFALNCVLIAGFQGPVVVAMGRMTRARALQLAALTSIASCAVLLAASPVPRSAAVALVLLGVAVFTVGELMESPVMATLSAEAAPDHLRGRYLAAYQTSWNVSSFVAPVLLTSLLAVGGLAVFGVLALLAALTAVGIALVTPHLPAARVLVGAAPTET